MYELDGELVMFLHTQQFRNVLSSLENPRITNFVSKFSTWFLESTRNFFTRIYFSKD